MQNRWLQTRRHFYEILKKQAHYILGRAPKELANYENRYSRIFEQVWEVSSTEQIHEKIKQANLVIGGDFHAFSQSQRAHLRLLREVYSYQPHLMLGLEVFDEEDQIELEAYLTGDLNLSTLFNRTGWKEKWPGIPIHGYEMILEWAKKNKLKVYGLNKSSEPSLKGRDKSSGKLIDNILEKNPNNLFYILYGDFHLAKEHLIANIEHYDSERDIRIFLNSDELYFALAEHAVEDRFDVLSLGDSFCILSSPPWVKWQSYLLSLQEMEDEFIDDQEDWESTDLTEYVAQMLDVMVKDFEQVDLSSNLSVYSSREVDLEYIYDQDFSDEELQKIEYLVSSEKNILFPKEGFQYLGRTTVNQAASLAGEVLHAHLAKRDFPIWQKDLSFEAKVWLEAVSFFFSLTINPKRKAMSEKDLTIQLQAHGEKEYAQEVLELALDYRLSIVQKAKTGTQRVATIAAKNWETELEASVILGEIMGKRLFESYRKGDLERETLIHYFSLPLDSLKFNAMFDFLNGKLEN